MRPNSARQDRKLFPVKSSVIDAFHLGRDQSRGGLIIGDMVGHRIEANARSLAYPLCRRLTPADARAVAARLEHVLAGDVSFAQVLAMEADAGPDSYRACLGDPAKLRAVVESEVGPLPMDDAAIAREYRPLLEDAARGYRPMMDALMAWATGPYTPTPPLAEPPNRMLVETFHVAVEAHYLSRFHQAQNHMLLAVVAIQAYHATHGMPPASLDALCPGILRGIPTDPFAEGEPLCYRPMGSSYVLYSRGPDGRDDGGAVMKGPPGELLHVSKDSVGDLVAGVMLLPIAPRTAAWIERANRAQKCKRR